MFSFFFTVLLESTKVKPRWQMWVNHICSDPTVYLAELKTQKWFFFRIRIECEARIGRSSQPSTATTMASGTLLGGILPGATLPGGTLATKPSSSRLPPEATTVHMIRGRNPDSRASHRKFLTTLSSGPTTTVAADLKSVALNISSRMASQPHSESRPPTSNGEANSESNLNKKSPKQEQTEKRPKTELETTTQTATWSRVGSSAFFVTFAHNFLFSSCNKIVFIVLNFEILVSQV